MGDTFALSCPKRGREAIPSSQCGRRDCLRSERTTRARLDRGVTRDKEVRFDFAPGFRKCIGYSWHLVDCECKARTLLANTVDQVLVRMLQRDNPRSIRILHHIDHSNWRVSRGYRERLMGSEKEPYNVVRRKYSPPGLQWTFQQQQHGGG